MAAGLAAKRYRVLGIDLDPQGNFSTACGAENYNVQTIYEVMKRAASIQDAIQHTKGGYDVVPANIMLAGAEQELSQTGKEHRLKEAVAPVAGDYDFIVIDTPPSLGVLTVNAFTCATDILIPTTAGIFATAGISQLNETVTSVQKYCNPAVKVRGILFTRFNPRGEYQPADEGTGGAAWRIHFCADLQNIYSICCSGGGGSGEQPGHF